MTLRNKTFFCKMSISNACYSGDPECKHKLVAISLESHTVLDCGSGGGFVNCRVGGALARALEGTGRGHMMQAV